MEVVVRAQKFKIEPRAQSALNSGINHFYGTVKNRSYMGGEISYFVELENGTMAHVINLVVSQSLQRGEEVAVQVDPVHCRLLPGK